MSQFNNIMSKIVTNKKTPVVLTVVACTGVVATGVMASKAGTRAAHILADKDPKAPLKQKVRWTWKLYAPVVGVGTTTILAIIAMNRVTAKNAAILTAGATLATTTLQEYQQHVLEELGAEKESKIRDKMAKRRFEASDQSIADMIVLAGEEVICYDEFSGRYFKSNHETLRSIENDINKEILSGIGGSISLNEVYDAMGLEPCDVGNIVGFNLETPVDFHFATVLTSTKKPALSVGFIHFPVEDYANFT